MDKKNLYKYFRGEASPEEENIIIDWTEESPENKRKFLEERKIWNSLLIHYYLKADDNNKQKYNRFWSISEWKVIGLVASLAVIMVFSYLFISDDQQESRFQTIIAPPSQRTEIILEDGTKVWLNSKSKLSYNSLLSKSKREVILDGEAYFDVTKDPDKPFIVHTNKYDIEVLGTSFNVIAYEKSDIPFEVSLLQGSVNVISLNNSARPIVLKKNEKITERNDILEKGIIENNDQFRWRDGIICLDDVSLDELSDKFSIYFDTQIKVENEELLKYRCTGKFRQNDGIEYALKVLQKDLKFSYYRNESSNTIIIK